jgi:hypothetical protein
VLEESTTTLKVTSCVANAGWKDTILTPACARMHVGFQQVGAPQEHERFWARLNTAGTVVNIILQSCT